jgi:hypothetical protein
MASHQRLLRDAGLASPTFFASARASLGAALVHLGYRLQTTGRPDMTVDAAGGSGAG